MEDAKGPGCTRWEADDNGGITCIRWNDPSWRTHFMDKHELTAWSVASKLKDAYEAGRRDQAELMRRAISYGAKP